MGVVLAVSRGSAAHVDLLSPTPRAPGRSADPNANLKEAPCGQEQNARASTATVFAPGETIEVRWKEYVNHRSYYRVAFDPDGDDGFPIFPGAGTSAEGHDPAALCPVDGKVILAYELNDGVADEHTLRVTLPDIECDGCTLQLIQYMYDTGRPYYFQCADLELRRGDAGAADSGDAGGSGSNEAARDFAEFRAAASCSAPLPPRPRRGDEDAGAPPASARDASTFPSTPEEPPSTPVTGSQSSRSGCSLALPWQRSAPLAWLLWAPVVAALAGRSRRRR